MQIGKPRSSKGSNDIANLRLPAKTFLDKETNELYVADGYGNHRVIVFDADTGKYKRHWGAYGNKPDDVDLGRYDPKAPPAQQFRNPVHCADLSVDRLLYVCDRVNDRIQVFKPDGTFVKEGVLQQGDARLRLGLGRRLLEGSAAEVSCIWPTARTTRCTSSCATRSRCSPASAKAAGSRASSTACTASRPTRKGNIYTTETYRGQRVQKFTYKGLAPVTKKDQGVVWPPRPRP